jgi:hypothetical protein
MTDLHAAGKPVDQVTVTWEAGRRGIAMTPGQIGAALDGGTAVMALPSARAVHRHGALARAVRAGRDIQAQACDPASTPGRLLRAVDERLRGLEQEQAALLAARSSPQPAPSRTEPALTACASRQAGHLSQRSPEARHQEAEAR